MGDFYDQDAHFIPDFACKVTHFHLNDKSYCMFFLLLPVKNTKICQVVCEHIPTKLISPRCFLTTRGS